jgi:hypothetical protein
MTDCEKKGFFLGRAGRGTDEVVPIRDNIGTSKTVGPVESGKGKKQEASSGA